MKLKPSATAHAIAYAEIAELLKRQEQEHGLTAMELLAIASNIVGKVVAMQDQRAVTPAQAMAIVASNIDIGNAEAVAELLKSKGSA